MRQDGGSHPADESGYLGSPSENVLTDIPNALKQYKVRIEEEGKALLFEEEKSTLNDILKAIQAEDIVIERIDLDPTTLEDVFANMTRSTV